MEEIINKLVEEKFKSCIIEEVKDNDSYWYRKGIKDGIKLKNEEIEKLNKIINDLIDQLTDLKTNNNE
jgi:hypothetical protein